MDMPGLPFLFSSCDYRHTSPVVTYHISDLTTVHVLVDVIFSTWQQTELMQQGIDSNGKVSLN
jgi:hypothetical protein